MTRDELLDDLQKLLRRLDDEKRLGERATAERILLKLRDMGLAVVSKAPGPASRDAGALALGTSDRGDRIRTAEAMYRDMVQKEDLARLS